MQSRRAVDPPIAVLAHGAASSSGFLAQAFPADRLGVGSCAYLDDRTGSVSQIRASLRKTIERLDAPVIVGGVSIGSHAAAQLLADPPLNVIGAVLCLPAWTGAPESVADMTGVAAEAVAVLGQAGVLAELPEEDWVTEQLREAWAQRSDAELTAELRMASKQPGPTSAQLRAIRVPVGLVHIDNDPLHPASVAAQWAREIPRSAVASVGRAAPGEDLAIFADAARRALREAWSTDV